MGLQLQCARFVSYTDNNGAPDAAFALRALCQSEPRSGEQSFLMTPNPVLYIRLGAEQRELA